MEGMLDIEIPSDQRETAAGLSPNMNRLSLMPPSPKSSRGNSPRVPAFVLKHKSHSLCLSSLQSSTFDNYTASGVSRSTEFSVIMAAMVQHLEGKRRSSDDYIPGREKKQTKEKKAKIKPTLSKMAVEVVGEEPEPGKEIDEVIAANDPGAVPVAKDAVSEFIETNQKLKKLAAQHAWRVLRRHVMEVVWEKRAKRLKTSFQWKVWIHHIKNATNPLKGRQDLYQKYLQSPNEWLNKFKTSLRADYVDRNTRTEQWIRRVNRVKVKEFHGQARPFSSIASRLACDKALISEDSFDKDARASAGQNKLLRPKSSPAVKSGISEILPNKNISLFVRCNRQISPTPDTRRCLPEANSFDRNNFRRHSAREPRARPNTPRSPRKPPDNPDTIQPPRQAYVRPVSAAVCTSASAASRQDKDDHKHPVNKTANRPKSSTTRMSYSETDLSHFVPYRAMPVLDPFFAEKHDKLTKHLLADKPRVLSAKYRSRTPLKV